MKKNENTRKADRANLLAFLQKIDSFDRKMEQLKSAINGVTILKKH